MRGCAMALAAGVLGLAAPSAAQAEITQVFTDTATPVDCTVQTGANEGIRYCTNQSPEPRSTVPTWDGVPIDVNVAFPPEDPYGDAYDEGPFPVMMLFHGYAGSKLGLGSMKHWLDQGYATFSITTRGNHQSCGTTAARTAGGAACDGGYLRLMDTRYEVRDAQELIALLVDEGLIDPGAIGATGGSYGGGMSMALAALRNRMMLPDGSLDGLGVAERHSARDRRRGPRHPVDRPRVRTRPQRRQPRLHRRCAVPRPRRPRRRREGGLRQRPLCSPAQANGYYAPEGQDPEADITGWKNALDTGGPYGAEELEIVEEITTHHSSYYIDDSVKPAPLLISSGFTDDLFPANEATRFFNRTLTTYPNAHIGLTFGDFGHPRGQGRAETNAFISERKDEWLAHYVLGEGSEPEEGIDALTQSCGEPPAGPYHGTDVNDLAPGEITLESGAGPDHRCGRRDRRRPLRRVLRALLERRARRSAPATAPPARSTSSPAAPAGGYTLMGSPTVIADFDAPGDNTQIAARLMDIAPDNSQKLIARGLWRPEIGGPERQVFQLTPNGWEFEAGHVAKLELLPYDDPYGRRSPGQQAVQVSDLELRLPVADDPGSAGGLVDEALPVVLPEGTQEAPGFDATAPETSVNLTKKHGDVKAKFFSTEDGSTFECKRQEKWKTCESPKVFKKGIKKNPKLKVRAIDRAGNDDQTPAKVRLDSVLD